MTNAEIRVFTEKKISGRYITNTDVTPLLEQLPKHLFKVDVIGDSVLGDSIYKVLVGNGDKKVFMWSQMHGNESTTTKALFDLFNLLASDSPIAKTVIDSCTICVVPLLNPDGAKAYTRINANAIDLNRDAKDLSQPESILLRTLFNEFNPNYCFNLHGQRTIFGVGDMDVSASVSFLAPSQDKECSVTDNRKVAMSIIAAMNSDLQQDIPNGVGLYDDAFNDNCVGDTFQSLNVPTILFEAGHYPGDYNREETRFLIFKSLLTALRVISEEQIDVVDYSDYFKIPNNKKSFFDIIVKNVCLEKEGSVLDLAFQYKEVINGSKVDFIPVLSKIDGLENYRAHKTIEGQGLVVSSIENDGLEQEKPYSFIMLGNNKLSLLLH